jgi:nicotinamidase-related amidase
MRSQLPLPPHFAPDRIGEVWRVPYEERAAQADDWRREHGIRPAAQDEQRLCLVLVDIQNTFCTPGFELFVGGRTGRGALEDNERLCGFLYRNLDSITRIVPTLDTHQALQIFHALWLVDEQGRHPGPYTLVSAGDVERGRWRVDPAAAASLGLGEGYAQRHLIHYARRLEETGKYGLTIWPYHALLGGIGHALVSAVEEAVFFHTVAREGQPAFQIKGLNPLTEHYSALGPEVTEGPDGDVIAAKNEALLDELLSFDAVVVAGQAKSHCVAWTVDDLLREIGRRDPALAGRIYLLEDCSSPVVVPDAVDYTDDADDAYRRFAAAGMHVVRSTEPLETWPGLAAAAGVS